MHLFLSEQLCQPARPATYSALYAYYSAATSSFQSSAYLDRAEWQLNCHGIYPKHIIFQLASTEMRWGVLGLHTAL